MAVDQSETFRSKRSECWATPEEALPNPELGGDDLTILELKPPDWRINITLRHLKWLMAGVKSVGRFFLDLADALLYLGMTILKGIKLVFIVLMTILGMISILIGVVAWSEPETIAHMLAPPRSEGSTSSGLVGCVEQSGPSELPVWP